MYKKIIVGIDGSEDAYKVVKKVVDFYKTWYSKIVVFHSIEQHMVMPEFSILGNYQMPISSYSAVRNDYTKLGQRILEDTKKVFEEANVPLETRLISDIRPEDYAIETAKEEDFDLIILGSRGHHSKLGILLGSVASKVVNNATCDVLIIR